MSNINSIINKSNITKFNKKKIRRLVNVIVGIRLLVHSKANVNRNVWCIKWKCIVIRVVIKNKKVYFGSTQGDFKIRYYNHRTSFSPEKYRRSTT